MITSDIPTGRGGGEKANYFIIIVHLLSSVIITLNAGSTPAASTSRIFNKFIWLDSTMGIIFGDCVQDCAYLCPYFCKWIPNTTSQRRCHRGGSNSECSGRRFYTPSMCPHGPGFWPPIRGFPRLQAPRRQMYGGIRTSDGSECRFF